MITSSLFASLWCHLCVQFNAVVVATVVLSGGNKWLCLNDTTLNLICIIHETVTIKYDLVIQCER